MSSLAAFLGEPEAKEPEAKEREENAADDGAGESEGDKDGAEDASRGDADPKDADSKDASKTADKAADEGSKGAQSPSPGGATAKQPSEYVPITAFLGEKRAHQETKRKLAEIEARLAGSRPAETADEDEDGAIWDDPRTAFAKEMTARDRKETARFINLSESLTRPLYKDYDAMVAEFHQAAEQDATLYQRMEAAPNPAAYAYASGKAFKRLREIGDLDQYEEKTRAEIEAELRPKIEEELRKGQSTSSAAKVSRSLAGARGGGQSALPETFEPPSMDSILAGRKRRKG